jgi:hypothetical protein
MTTGIQLEGMGPSFQQMHFKFILILQRKLLSRDFPSEILYAYSILLFLATRFNHCNCIYVIVLKTEMY